MDNNKINGWMEKKKCALLYKLKKLVHSIDWGKNI